MNDPAIRVDGLGKQYRLGMGAGGYGSLRESISAAGRSVFRRNREQAAADDSTIWALRDATFELARGEVVGVIGRNGAGKSTLLKLLSRITEPTEGSAQIRGRVGSLLEVGTGFHPELSGRENIYLNGAILGMTRAEIRSKFDTIVDFSGVERFIDTPVKRYSSGMYVRLAFAVAAHLDTEILLIDEVLAVGDAEFRQKCLGQMKEITGAGRTILFVSHNMAAVRSICSRVLLFDQGMMALDAGPEEAIARYLDQGLKDTAKLDAKSFERSLEGVIRKTDPTIRLQEVAVTKDSGIPSNAFTSDEAVCVSVRFECLEEVHNLRLIVEAVDEENRPFLSTQNLDAPDHAYRHAAGVYEATCRIPPDTFGGRRFYVSIQLIHPKVEHLILKKVLPVDVHFQGYNGYHDAWKDTFLRPNLEWACRPLTETRKGNA